MSQKKANPMSEANDPIFDGKFTPTIHVCWGRIGGIGKTMLARILCEHYIYYKKKYLLIDADRNANVARAYDKDTVKKWSGKVEEDAVTHDAFDILAGLEDTTIEEKGLLSEQIFFSDNPEKQYLT